MKAAFFDIESGFFNGESIPNLELLDYRRLDLWPKSGTAGNDKSYLLLFAAGYGKLHFM